MTSDRSDGPLVVTGILLEAYSGGSLQQALTEDRVAEYSWKPWALQIRAALKSLHEAKKTHMDIKPSNVVLDADGNAVLIDISGIGGTTLCEWCSQRFEIRYPHLIFRLNNGNLNDIWAYGKLLSTIASQARDDPYVKTLNRVALCLMEEDCQARMSLSRAISRL
jgi:serine/threonine protein kinase